jgi:hypothetical protein
MRLFTASLLLGSLLVGCGDSGDEDTGADDESSTMSIATAPESGSEGQASSEGDTTGGPSECDANVEFAVADGVQLGAQSVDAVRLEVGGDVQYTVTIVGDAAGATQLDIVYPGLPAAMEYQATSVMDQFGQPRVELMPEAPVDFVAGTVTYTMVGTAEGETLALEFDLEWEAGTIAGCVQTGLTVETN